MGQKSLDEQQAELDAPPDVIKKANNRRASLTAKRTISTEGNDEASLPPAGYAKRGSVVNV